MKDHFCAELICFNIHWLCQLKRTVKKTHSIKWNIFSWNGYSPSGKKFPLIYYKTVNDTLTQWLSSSVFYCKKWFLTWIVASCENRITSELICISISSRWDTFPFGFSNRQNGQYCVIDHETLPDFINLGNSDTFSVYLGYTHTHLERVIYRRKTTLPLYYSGYNIKRLYYMLTMNEKEPRLHSRLSSTYFR